MIKQICVAAMWLAFQVPTLAQSPNTSAPMGLEWGATVDVVKKLGVELTSTSGKDYGASFTASNLPAALSDQSTTLLSFGHDDRLWRILVRGKDSNADPGGSATRARYDELATILAEKYGRPHVVHSLGGSIYKEHRYFLAGIRGGDSNWYSDFKTPGVNVQLGIRAKDSSTGYYLIIFENNPLGADFDRSKKTREKGAL